jgi:hypothetical protein
MEAGVTQCRDYSRDRQITLYSLVNRAFAPALVRRREGRNVAEKRGNGPSAADLKFLQHLQQTRSGTSNRKAAPGP